MNEEEFKTFMDEIFRPTALNQPRPEDEQMRRDFERIGADMLGLFTNMLNNSYNRFCIYRILPIVYRMGVLDGGEIFKKELLYQMILQHHQSNPNDRPN